MSHQLRQEYLNLIRERYKNSCRIKKTAILNEFCQVCGYSRKYAIAILNGQIEPTLVRPRGRTLKYTSDFLFHLVRLWRALGKPGSVKLKAALPEWIRYDEHPDLAASPELVKTITDVSRAHLDRLLRPYRQGPQTGVGGTRSCAPRIKNQIPVQAKDWNITEPGQQVQADTVGSLR